MSFNDIPIRENGKGNFIFASWFNTIRTELINAFGSGGYIKEMPPAVVANGAEIQLDPTGFKPMANIAGDGGAVTVSSTPFGVGHGFTGGKEIILVGTSDTEPVTLEVNDIDDGIVANGKIILTKYSIACFVYNSNLKRFIRKDMSP